MKTLTSPLLALGLATALVAPACYGQTSADLLSEKPAAPSSELKDITESKDMGPVRASKLLGINVSSKDGDNLGEVQDLVFDAETGEIKFALVGQGFMAGLGQKMVPVPWQAVNLHSEREFALNVDKKKLQMAPHWSEADLDAPEYIIRIYHFFEMEPSSAVGGLGSSTSEFGEGAGSSSDAEPADEISPNSSIKDNPAEPELPGNETPD